MRFYKLGLIFILLGSVFGCANQSPIESKENKSVKVENESDSRMNHEASFQKLMLMLLPEAPAGYSWAAYRNAAIVKPSGWNEKILLPEDSIKSTGALAISPEDFSEAKPFEHGATIQVVTKVKAKTNLSTKDYAAYLVAKSLVNKPKEEVLIFDKSVIDAGKPFVVRYKVHAANETPIIVHKYFISNSSTDTVHIFTYESQESSWDENWKKYGDVIFKKIMVVPQAPFE